jgi:hypothetical protein
MKWKAKEFNPAVIKSTSIAMDPKFIKKAKEELGEDELKKSQSLQQFREYISKHQYFSNVPQGKKVLIFDSTIYQAMFL